MSDIIRLENVSVTYQKGKRSNRSLWRLFTGLERTVGQKSNKTPTNFHALKDLSFSVTDGQVLGVVGHNGAGKSTLLKIIGNIFSPDSGKVTVNGRVSTLLSLGAGFQMDLDGIHNIYLNGLLMGLSLKEVRARADDIIQFSELGDFIYEPLRHYSSGMVSRLGFSIAAFAPCEILLVDEILGVGDKEFKKKSRAKIQELIRSNRTVVLVSHSLEDIMAFSDQVIWLDRGQLKMIGSPASVVAAYEGHFQNRPIGNAVERTC